MRRVVVMSLAVTCGWASAIHADEGFTKFVDDYFASQFAARPSGATSSGVHNYDDRLEDMSRAAIDRRVAELKGQLRSALKFDSSNLSFDEAIDRDVIETQIRGELLDLETIQYWRTNPMLYAGLPGQAIDVLIKRDFAPAKERLKAVIAREKQVPAVFAAAKANIENPPKEFTDLAIRMAKGSVGFFEGSVAQWAVDAAGSDVELKKEFDETNTAVVTSLKDFAAWLETELEPRSKGNYAIGAETFLNKLKYEEMITLSLDELLERGERNLKRDYEAFVAAAKKIDPKKSPAEVMKSLSNDHPTAETLIPSVKSSVERARQFLIDKKIVTVPSDVRCRIEETPPYARSGGFASMDTPGPYETKATEAFYYVTPVESDWDPKHKEEHLRLFNAPVVDLINIHEAYPGHYLQFLYAPRFPTKTRKLVACGSNAEGWAHYTEQMMIDEGFGDGDPKLRLAQLQEALLRDCRYINGIKLHTAGWTVERGAKLFEEMGFQEPANAFEESRRGAYNPTYLYYTFGKLEIQKLRDEYLAKKKGATVRDFHDAFVSEGGLPLPLVRRILFR